MSDPKPLFLIDLTYCVPLERIERHLPAHMDYLRDCFDSGHFISCGPKVPRDGGMILTRAADRAEAAALAARDPFLIHQVAEARITEFLPRMNDAAFAAVTG